DDKKCMKKVEPSSRSKAIEDIISIGSFVEALVLNHYVLVRKILVLLIRRTRLTPASLEMCMCLKDHMDTAERVQHTSNFENSLDFEEEILEEEVQEHEAIALSDEEIALDEAASEARSSEGEEMYDMTLCESD
ncbi:hypothetical protein Tco_1271214, partial [Tanacetum coccineum]